MLDGSLVTLILFGLFGYLFYLYLTWNYKYWWKRGVNGPKPKVISGTFPSMFSADKNIVSDMCNANKNFKETENFVGMYTFRQPQLLILNPSSIKEVLVEKFDSFHDNDISKNVDKEVDEVLSQSPFFSQGDLWKNSRKTIEPAFQRDTVKNSYQSVLEVCGRLVNFLEKKSQYPPINGINTKDFVLRFTSEIISHVIYGSEAGDFEKEEASEFHNLATYPFARSLFTNLYFLIPKSLRYRKIPFLPESTVEFLNKHIQSSIQNRKGNKDKKDFLDFLIKLEGLSSSQISSHAITFMIDGFETTATTIAHTLLLIARNPECQERLRSEIDAKVEADGHLSFENLNDLPYLDMCINESLRIFPPLLYSTKVCTKDCQLVNKNDQPVLVPAGCGVVIPTYTIHHDEEYYSDPEEFKPERFSETKLKSLSDQGVFLPFGLGPRKCLGVQYANAQVKAVIVEIVRHFNVKMNANTRTDNQIDGISYVASLEGGIWLDFEAIKKSA
ncbi:hypothetical protein ACFFRR_002544 [Megaselia abdita]